MSKPTAVASEVWLLSEIPDRICGLDPQEVPGDADRDRRNRVAEQFRRAVVGGIVPPLDDGRMRFDASHVVSWARERYGTFPTNASGCEWLHYEFFTLAECARLLLFGGIEEREYDDPKEFETTCDALVKEMSAPSSLGRLHGIRVPDPEREHKLYREDWLVRFKDLLQWVDPMKFPHFPIDTPAGTVRWKKLLDWLPQQLREELPVEYDARIAKEFSERADFCPLPPNGADPLESGVPMESPEYWRRLGERFEKREEDFEIYWGSIHALYTLAGSKEQEEAFCDLARQGSAGIECEKEDSLDFWLDLVRGRGCYIKKGEIMGSDYGSPTLEGIDITITRAFRASADLCLRLEAEAVERESTLVQVEAVATETMRLPRQGPAETGETGVKNRLISPEAAVAKMAAALESGERRSSVETWQDFRERRGLSHTHVALFKAARKDKAEFYKWLRGALADGSAADRAIRSVLLDDLETPFPR